MLLSGVKTRKQHLNCTFLFFRFRHVINEFFNHLFFNIYVKAQHTDKCKFFQEILVFFLCIFVGVTGHFVFSDNVFCQGVNLLYLQSGSARRPY